MLRGEHDKSDRRSSSALDRGMPSRAEYLPSIAAAVAQRAPVEHQAGAAWSAAPRRCVGPPGAQEMPWFS